MAQKYVASGTIRHGLEDGTVLTFKNGEEFTVDDPKVVEALVFAGSLVTPEEFAAAEAAEGRPQLLQEMGLARQSLEDENAALRAQLAELQAASSKGGKKASAEPDQPAE